MGSPFFPENGHRVQSCCSARASNLLMKCRVVGCDWFDSGTGRICPVKSRKMLRQKSSEKFLKMLGRLLELFDEMAILLLVQRREKGAALYKQFFGFKTLPCAWLETKSFDRKYIAKRGESRMVFNDRPSLEVDEARPAPMFLRSVQRNC